MRSFIHARRARSALATAISAMVWLVAARSEALELTGDITACHDPSRMIEWGGRTYLFSTAPNLKLRSSSDRVTWRWENRVFSYASGMPPWMDAIASGDNLWAPDVLSPRASSSGPFLLFYSRNLGLDAAERSTCGVASSSSVTGPWTDQGAILDVNVAVSFYRAIDPAPVFDSQGRLWISVGSYGAPNGDGYANGGIRLFELDPKTGALLTMGDQGTRLAGSWIEASFIFEHQGAYYLFFNQGACCRGLNSTYFVRVGRAATITGPYSDMDGVSLLTPSSGGSLFMGRQFDANFTGEETAPVPRPNMGQVGREVGPGHAAIVAGADGIERVSYHSYDGNTANGEPTLGIKTILWGPDGWPRPGWNLAEGTIAIGSRLNADPASTVALFLDVAQGTPSLAPYTGVTTQLWDVHHVDLNRFTLVSRASGKALAIGADGAITVAAASASELTQRWFIEQTNDSSFRVINVSSGRAMELPQGPSTAGAVPRTGVYGVKLTNQHWFLTPAGAYRIRSSSSELFLTSGGGTGTAGSTLTLERSVASPTQYFWLIPRADGSSAIINVASGLVMAVAGASRANAARVQQEVDVGGMGQRWSADTLTDGSTRLVPMASGKALEIVAASTQPGATVQQNRWLHVRNQQWRLELQPEVGPPATGGSADAGNSTDAGGASDAGEWIDAGPGEADGGDGANDPDPGSADAGRASGSGVGGGCGALPSSTHRASGWEWLAAAVLAFIAKQRGRGRSRSH